MRIRIIGGLARAENFQDDEAEIWSLNGIVRPWMPRVDRMFNLHTLKRLLDYHYDIERDIQWAAQNSNVPFYTMDEWPRVSEELADVLSRRAYNMLPLKSQNIFPLSELMTRYPRGTYHCGSFDWLVSFAIMLHETVPGRRVDEIVLHGIGMVLEPGEPISGRACLEYWCGIAEGKGIKVTCARDTDIFRFYHLVKSDLIYSVDDTPIYEDRTKDARSGAPYTLKD